MSASIDSELKKAAKGTAIIFSGSIVNLLLAFIIKILIVRNTTQSEFGVYSLSITVVGIITLVSALGLKSGVARYISYFKGRGDEENAKRVSGISLKIGIATGTVSFLALFILSVPLSNNLFHLPDMAQPLKILSFVIPFIVVNNIFIAILRGRGRFKEKVYFMDTGQPLVFLILTILFLLVKLPYIYFIVAYLLSRATVSVLLSLNARKHHYIGRLTVHSDKLLGKEMLLFSIPLMIISLKQVAYNRVDTLMVGYLMGPENVAIYDVGFAIARLSIVPLLSLSFVLLPIAGQLYSQNNIPGLKKTYQAVSKWVVTIIFPIFLTLFFFPETVLGTLFGVRYIVAANIIRVLSLGFMFHAFMGLSPTLMIVIGKSKDLMWISIFGSILNIILNYVMISFYGVMGAALATAVSYVISKALISYRLYKYNKIHPITMNYIKPILMSTFIIAVLFKGLNNIPDSSLKLLFVFLMVLTSFTASLFLTKSIGEEDILLFEMIERRSGINLKIIRKIVRRFL